MPHSRVRPDIVNKSDASAALCAGWARVISRMGKGSFADTIGVDTKTISRSLSGDSVPELHTALNSLFADPTALDELGALYGFEFRPRRPVAANDLETLSDLSHLVGKWAEALADGQRCHHETLTLASQIRPLIKALSAVCSEADKIRGVA